jgi:hypothetical protein
LLCLLESAAIRHDHPIASAAPPELRAEIGVQSADGL